MGWENITYRCGHTDRKQMYGKLSERARKVEFYKTIDCPLCQTESAKRWANENGLPDLTGSERQINWAERIRREKNSFEELTNQMLSLAYVRIQTLEYNNNRNDILPEFNEMKESGEITSQALKIWMNDHEKSSWWIDRRDNDIADFIVDYIEGGKK